MQHGRPLAHRGFISQIRISQNRLPVTSTSQLGPIRGTRTHRQTNRMSLPLLSLHLRHPISSIDDRTLNTTDQTPNHKPHLSHRFFSSPMRRLHVERYRRPGNRSQSLTHASPSHGSKSHFDFQSSNLHGRASHDRALSSRLAAAATMSLLQHPLHFPDRPISLRKTIHLLPTANPRLRVFLGSDPRIPCARD